VKEDVKLQVDSSGRIVVKGERQASEQKRVNFHLSFPAPEDSEVDKIAGKFDGGILYVTLPKRIIQEKNKQSDTEETGISNVERAEEHDSHKTNADSDVEGRDHNQHVGHEEHEEERNENAHMPDFSGQVRRKWDQETMLRTAVDVLSKNKGIVVTAVIAFSLGMYVSSKFQFSEAP
jgi:HSP20 family molecular chaperone IbpA